MTKSTLFFSKSELFAICYASLWKIEKGTSLSSAECVMAFRYRSLLPWLIGGQNLWNTIDEVLKDAVRNEKNLIVNEYIAMIN
ncbi:MAG: hypothetical protein SAK29_41855 [Scytonema sp. PMC 1069.18]|nr:hypothetical protein [Scytonema sp. PMC 1069.18]MEC4880124.1 hypothetical protein [Scytonema sp. PMC 1070.18]